MGEVNWKAEVCRRVGLLSDASVYEIGLNAGLRGIVLEGETIRWFPKDKFSIFAAGVTHGLGTWSQRKSLRFDRLGIDGFRREVV